MRDQSSPFRLAVTATFTADPIAAPLAYWAEPLNTAIETVFAPFGQVLQSLLDPASLLRRNEHGLNLLLFRYQDLGAEDRRAENLSALAAALLALPAGPVPYLVIACAEAQPPDYAAFRDTLASRHHLYFVDSAWIAEHYPVLAPFSPEGEKLGAIPYTEDYFLALAATTMRVAHAHQHPPAKVLALDCDNTLWEGICGEDGPEGVRLTPGHEALQRFAVAQREQGTLLVLASKNNLADVEATFRAHPEFPLQWQHISAHRINWHPKPENLESLAQELSLGVDSFVFLDDSRKEVSEVARELPQVVSIQIPENHEELLRLTRHLWMLDRLRVTDADRERAASYEQTQAFGRALAKAQSLEDFYQHLELQVQVRGVENADFPRAAQLTQRTNQFNFTTLRRSADDLQRLWQDRYEIFRIDTRDRFGDYGFTGLVIGRAEKDVYALDTFLLSCRVLGRGVEHAILRWLAAHVERLGLRRVSLPFTPTAKNQPAAAFLAEIGAASFPCLLDTAQLASVQLRSVSPPPAPSTSTTKASSPTPTRSLDYAYIARELASVEQLRRALRPDLPHQLGVFATTTETRLAQLWAELLPGATIEADSNFFELGGHSLLAVLLLTRISESFGVELGIDEAYSIDMTLERMARRIDEAAAFSGLGRQEYQALCAEIARLSDEEVEAALRREEQEDYAASHAHSARL